MNDVAVLTEIVVNHTGASPRGVSCKFIKIDEQWGIKVYRKLRERDRAYNRQKKMAELGYAPAVGCQFDIGLSKYCYITEIAEMLIDSTLEDKEWNDECDRVALANPSLEDDIEELVSDMNDAGYDFGDTHFGNFGRLRGKLVCIDFGDY